jgi:hypothetical protein
MGEGAISSQGFHPAGYSTISHTNIKASVMFANKSLTESSFYGESQFNCSLVKFGGSLSTEYICFHMFSSFRYEAFWGSSGPPAVLPHCAPDPFLHVTVWQLRRVDLATETDPIGYRLLGTVRNCRMRTPPTSVDDHMIASSNQLAHNPPFHQGWEIVTRENGKLASRRALWECDTARFRISAEFLQLRLTLGLPGA